MALQPVMPTAHGMVLDQDLAKISNQKESALQTKD